MEIRHTIGTDCVELRVRLGGGPIAWDSIGKAVVALQVRWNPNTEATAEISAALLADNFRHWGSGSVRGVFRTDWERQEFDFVVRAYYQGR